MVTKSRSVNERVPSSINSIALSDTSVRFGYENMADSSASGSARTELDAVDRFLADPTNRHDFHRALRESNKSAGDAGLADFRVDRTMTTRKPFSATLIGNTGNRTTLKNVIASVSHTTGFPPLTPYSPPNKAQLSAQGQTLYHQALPMKNQADLGVTVMEIVSNPVRALTLPGTALKRAVEVQGTSIRRLNRQAVVRHRQIRGLPLEEARVAADDYLAYIFGLRPNVQTLDDLASAINKSRRSAELVVRDGSRRLRRRRSLPERYQIQSSVTHPATIALATNPKIGFLIENGTVHRFNEARQRTWFSAAFRMPVSDTETWLERADAFFHRIDYLSGIGLDVRTAWDLVPFSFVVDWFANTGDFLENRQVVADYNIVTEYGYVMSHTTHTRTFTYSGTLRAQASSTSGQAFYGKAPVDGSGAHLVETKLRARCDSFGFKTNWDNLNAQQWSALTALGLTFSAGVRPTVRQ